MKSIKVIDLFCGIGGLSHWLTKAGLKVTAGFDIDGTCKFGYEHNNNAKFYQQDIKTLEAKKLKDIFWNANIKISWMCSMSTILTNEYKKMNIFLRWYKRKKSCR